MCINANEMEPKIWIHSIPENLKQKVFSKTFKKQNSTVALQN